MYLFEYFWYVSVEWLVQRGYGSAVLLLDHDMARLNDAPPPYYPASSTAGSVSNVSDSPNPSSKRVIREVVVWRWPTYLLISVP